MNPLKDHYKHRKLKNFTRCGRYGLKQTDDAHSTTCVVCQGTTDMKWYFRKNKKAEYNLRDFIKKNLWKTLEFYGTPVKYQKGRLLLLDLADANGNYVCEHVWVEMSYKDSQRYWKQRFKFKGLCRWYSNGKKQGYSLIFKGYSK